MNKTPVWFDIARGLTMNLKGTKTVHIQTTGNDKNKFTIVLTCLANGKKLPPIIIFKEKVWPANIPQLPAGIVVWFQEKEWIDELGMTHITDQTKTEFRSGNTDLAIIPEGLMSIYQPLDICAGLNTIYHWVLDTWNEISENIIVRAFKKYSISNCLLGSKDRLIYDSKLNKGKIEDFDDEEKFDKDNEDEEFDEVDEVEESNKNEEFDKDNESDSNESNYRVSNWPECFVLIEKRKS
ncbi:36793_t:CDS:2 [Gigaspora margarita]|uniref:36793_t:CDS:1 n=1 Tax=Gigaspora margarita TaxID=4874 RepID=A0ABN7WCF6_GIGMA|nr:36793_t:CDS:2 [Gigaspora margarita]